MLLRRHLLAAHVAGGPPAPRVVLMSATADAALFARYFAEAAGPPGVATLAIPGYTHPVADLYLEDALEATGSVVGRGSRYAKKGGPASAKVGKAGGGGSQEGGGGGGAVGGSQGLGQGVGRHRPTRSPAHRIIDTAQPP